MKKKLLSLMACFIMGTVVVTGCNSNTNDTEPTVTSEDGQNTETPATNESESGNTAEEQVQLKLGIWPEDTLTDDVKLHEGYVQTFNASHPNVEVVPSYYKYATDTFISLAESGNLPTIFETWYTEPQKLISGDFVADITDILQERGWLDSINPSIRELLSKDGRIYGIPRDGYALSLMLNVELFEEAGLVDENGYPLYPKTWQEVAETGKKIKDATGQAGFCLLAKDTGGGWHFSNIAWGFGATLCLDNGDGTFTANVNTPEAIEAMEYIKSLKWDYDILNADPTNEDWGSGFVSLGTGVAAMHIGANDAVNQPTQVNGLPVDKLAMVAVPAGPKGQYSLSGGTPYMFSKDATKEEINAALDYLVVMGKAPVATEDAIAGMRSDAENKVNAGVPVIPRFPCWIDDAILKAEEDIIEEFGNVDPKMFDSYFQATKTEGNLRMEEPGSAQDLYAELTKVLQAVITDKTADVPTLMKTANDNYQTLLNEKFN